MSHRAAAELYGLKKSTIAYHVKNPECGFGRGGAPILLKDEETEIYKWIVGNLQKGIPYRSLDIIGVANKVMERRLGSTGRVLGRGWLEKFNHRHKLSSGTREDLTASAAIINQPEIEDWFDNLMQELPPTSEHKEKKVVKRRRTQDRQQEDEAKRQRIFERLVKREKKLQDDIEKLQKAKEKAKKKDHVCCSCMTSKHQTEL